MTGAGLRILALDAAQTLCSVAVLQDGALIAERIAPGERGQVQRLAPMLHEVLDASGIAATALDVVAVTVGPGSFTGLRAALALAHGLALASSARLVGVTVAEALAAGLPELPGRALWVALDSLRGRIFLDRGDGAEAVTDATLPDAAGAVAVAGDAAARVAARLAARGVDTLLTDARQVVARHVARAALRQLAAGRASGPVVPLYVDAPEAALPQGGLRPAPA